jgi:membrane protease YdiL (CAAX protease family)
MEFIYVLSTFYYYIAPEDFVLLNLFRLFYLYLLSLLPIQTSTEEYVFRGYLMQGL